MEDVLSLTKFAAAPRFPGGTFRPDETEPAIEGPDLIPL